MRCAGIPLDLSADLEAVYARYDKIQDDKSGLEFHDLYTCLKTLCGDLCLISMTRHHFGKHFPYPRIITHYQDLCRFRLVGSPRGVDPFFPHEGFKIFLGDPVMASPVRCVPSGHPP
ncbi:MAG: hypothetical protein ABIE47_12605 [Pseudomonadota bacterium]